MRTITLTILLLFIASFSFSYGQWSSGGANNSNLNNPGDLYFQSPSLGFLTDDLGILRTTNKGVSWQLISNPCEVGPVDFWNSQVGYSAGKETGNICKTTDGGQSWNSMGSIAMAQGVSNYLEDLEVVNDSVVFAYQAFGGVFGFEGSQMLVSENSGLSWDTIALPMNTGLGCLSHSVFQDRMAWYDRQVGVAVVRDTFAFRTSDGGITWDSLAGNSENLRIEKVGDSTLYLGLNWVSHDRGLTWSTTPVNFTACGSSHLNDSSLIYEDCRVVGTSTYENTIYVSHDGGANTFQLPAPYFGCLGDLQYLGDSLIFGQGVIFGASGSGNALFKWNGAVVSRVVPIPIRLKVYPVPARNHLTVAGSSIGEAITGRIFNVNGQLVKEESQIVSNGTFRLGFETSALPQGIYLLEVEDGTHRTVEKIVLH